jgi:methylthioribose-1-phosphate isomerase
MQTILWKKGTVTTVDQTRLPSETVHLNMDKCDEIAEAIKTMKIRGAPLLGAAAAYGLALTAYHSKTEDREGLLNELHTSAKILKKTRPTAVNLFWAIDRILDQARRTSGDASSVAEMVIQEAQKIAAEDVQTNKRIGEHGSTIIDEGDSVMTHCNAGSLATVDYGTALGVIRAAWAIGKKISVIATETRPLLQGSRLTTYELQRDGIPVTLITDSMAGYVMARGMVSKIVLGADRIVKDAVINKIGTYTLAVLAHEHKVPFYVAAPKSTFDLNHLAKNVIVEERNAEEVTRFNGVQVAPTGISVFNPAFDITPFKYVAAIICEEGVFPPSTVQRMAHRD